MGLPSDLAEIQFQLEHGIKLANQEEIQRNPTNQTKPPPKQSKKG